MSQNPQGKKKGNPLNFPGLTPPAPPAEFKQEHETAFKQMQGKCYDALHRPMAVKIIGRDDVLYYICQECLDEYMKSHEELKKIVVGFPR